MILDSGKFSLSWFLNQLLISEHDKKLQNQTEEVFFNCWWIGAYGGSQ